MRRRRSSRSWPRRRCSLGRDHAADEMTGKSRFGWPRRRRFNVAARPIRVRVSAWFCKLLPLPLWAWSASRPKPTRGGGVLMRGARSPLLYAFLALPLLYLLALVAFPIGYNIAMSVQDVTLGNIARLNRP